MWLINTKTLRLEEILDYSTVRYAILSHTWGDDEVSFKDMQDFARAKRQAGFVKIDTTCQLALKEGLEYAWVDTCCIDKTSSAELSEAINAMFVWYQASTVCFVWLEDLAPLSATSKTTLQGRKLRDISKMSSCKWFSRGWTLQELIAPTEVRFYDADWNFRFTKENNVSTLSTITTIDVDVLKMTKKLKNVLVAVRMSWAAIRETTRPEDVAYCLLGIFDINMPLLYGEGEKAFQRLQENIVNQESDSSIFAWMAPFRPPLETQTFRGIFATSPRHFASSGQIRRSVFAPPLQLRLENKGLSLHSDIYRPAKDKPVETSLQLHLECFACDTPHEIAISLLNTGNGYVRLSSDSCQQVPGPQNRLQEEGLYCLRTVDPEDSEALEPFALKPLRIQFQFDIVSFNVYPAIKWSSHYGYFCGDALSEDFFGLIFFTPRVMPESLFFVLGINKLANKDVDLRFYYSDPGNSFWRVVGGYKEEDILTPKAPMNGERLSREYRSGKSSHLYGPKVSIWCEDPGALKGGANNAKVEAVVNGLEITISLSMWSTDTREVEEVPNHETDRGDIVQKSGNSLVKRQAVSPERESDARPKMRKSEKSKRRKR